PLAQVARRAARRGRRRRPRVTTRGDSAADLFHACAPGKMWVFYSTDAAGSLRAAAWLGVGSYAEIRRAPRVSRGARSVGEFEGPYRGPVLLRILDVMDTRAALLYRGR